MAKELIAGFTGEQRNDTIDREAEVAQLVEQLIRNQQVAGSSPAFGSIEPNNYSFRLNLFIIPLS